jgi:glycosyltransferase involved in cell wall biosynthesis
VNWVVVANVVPPPPEESRAPGGPFTFLFVGSLDYAPNKEGALFFCSSVLPLLRQVSAERFQVLIVGRRPEPAICQLEEIEDVSVIADPPDVGPYYRRADACIAPIYSGGGTRIKILEAFSYRLPVISTTIGAEGLGLIPAQHAVIADTAADFAAACHRLQTDPADRERLAEAGYQLYRKTFTPEAIRCLFTDVHYRLLEGHSSRDPQ